LGRAQRDSLVQVHWAGRKWEAGWCSTKKCRARKSSSGNRVREVLELMLENQQSGSRADAPRTHNRLAPRPAGGAFLSYRTSAGRRDGTRGQGIWPASSQEVPALGSSATSPTRPSGALTWTKACAGWARLRVGRTLLRSWFLRRDPPARNALTAQA